jgi:hypothetical protein
MHDAGTPMTALNSARERKRERMEGRESVDATRNAYPRSTMTTGPKVKTKTKRKNPNSAVQFKRQTVWNENQNQEEKKTPENDKLKKNYLNPDLENEEMK